MIKATIRAILGTLWLVMFVVAVLWALLMDILMSCIPRISDPSRYYDPR